MLRLLQHFEASEEQSVPETSPSVGVSVEPGMVAVHARYAGHKVPGEYDPASEALVIPSGPAQGRYKSPSGAATAVLQAYNPDVAPHRNGWSFWIVDATGARLQSLRKSSSTAEED
ncbi:hypothetical protein SAZ11_20510 [Streptomyces sp. FXJ1.4098]|nr:hypothetical protein [Streptomyces sp. FXJ1.4098]